MNGPWPEAYATRMREMLGAQANAFFEALSGPFERGLRLNPAKPLKPGAVDLGDPVPWCSQGFYLCADSRAGSDPLHEAGAYYLQEPSAMAPVRVLAPRPGERVLDLCAAPGGKSTQIAAALKGRGLLVANEPVPSRARVLSRNIERMGVPNALVVSAEPEQLARLWPAAFDAILADAPCSGEGMFRRHPEAAGEWNERAPAGCAARQARILHAAARMLKPGGRMVYSTCTFSPEENEQTVASFLSSEPAFSAKPFSLPIGGGKTLASLNGALRLYPHVVRGEGHFMALLEKREADEAGTAFAPAAERLSSPDKALLAAYGAFARDVGAALPQGGACFGAALVCAPPLPPLQRVRVLRAGLQLGTARGRVFLPDHALALCPGHALPAVPLTREEALLYQSGQTLPAPPGARGFVTPVYLGLPLGFAKASDGQLKNHYPKGLRRPAA